MKVRVTITVDIDTNRYLSEYGDADKSVIRDEVADAFISAIIDGGVLYPVDSGIIKNVEVK